MTGALTGAASRAGRGAIGGLMSRLRGTSENEDGPDVGRTASAPDPVVDFLLLLTLLLLLLLLLW